MTDLNRFTRLNHTNFNDPRMYLFNDEKTRLFSGVVNPFEEVYLKPILLNAGEPITINKSPVRKGNHELVIRKEANAMPVETESFTVGEAHNHGHLNLPLDPLAELSASAIAPISVPAPLPQPTSVNLKSGTRNSQAEAVQQKTGASAAVATQVVETAAKRQRVKRKSSLVPDDAEDVMRRMSRYK